MGAPQFYGFAEIDMDYSQEPSEVKRDRKKKERYQSILKRCIVCRVCFKRMKNSSNVSSFFFFKICDLLGELLKSYAESCHIRPVSVRSRFIRDINRDDINAVFTYIYFMYL